MQKESSISSNYRIANIRNSMANLNKTVSTFQKKKEKEAIKKEKELEKNRREQEKIRLNSQPTNIKENFQNNVKGFYNAFNPGKMEPMKNTFKETLETQPEGTGSVLKSANNLSLMEKAVILGKHASSTPPPAVPPAPQNTFFGGLKDFGRSLSSQFLGSGGVQNLVNIGTQAGLIPAGMFSNTRPPNINLPSRASFQQHFANSPGLRFFSERQNRR